MVLYSLLFYKGLAPKEAFGTLEPIISDMNREQTLITAMVLDMIIEIGLIIVAHAFPVCGVVCTILFIADFVFSGWLAMMLYKDTNNMEFLGFVGGIMVLTWQGFRFTSRD